jgi:type I restriction-modification system DNA methylase subunit
VEFGLIPKRDYGKLLKKKPDGLIVYHKEVKGIVEAKSPSQLNTIKKENAAIKQSQDTAKKLCKLLIITNNSSKSLWINPLRGERIKGKKGEEIKTLFDAKLTKNINEIESLIEEIDLSVDENNSTLKEERVIDPSDLARRMWQTIWVATGKSPVKCLYNVVELLIFKFLSDLKVLSGDFNFDKVFGMCQISPDDALTYYARNSRIKIIELFPKGKDDTTIMNGTIFVNEAGEPNISQSVLFHHSLKHLQDYENNFGNFVKIDKTFKTRLYETFLKQEVEALGQYFTTRKIVQSIVRMARLDEEDFDYRGKRICDPFCGVGGFLLEILNLNEKMKQCYMPNDKGQIRPPFVMQGFDKGFERDDERTIILAKANMLIYLSDVIFKYPKLTKEFSEQFNNTFTLFRDNLATFNHIVEDEKQKYDYILTNPPYVTRGAGIIKEEIKSKHLEKYYPINARGLEGLSIEWIIRSLVRGGKAFIIVPDGVMERNGDRRLRDYILQECYLDAIISLPVRTFFANFRKTYILALTKKSNLNEKQKHGIYTYLISNIGEELTKKNREVIDANNLPEMEKLFAMYSIIKTKPELYHEIKSGRCKILPFDAFASSKHWRVEKWWNDEELKKMGLLEEETGIQEMIDSLDAAKEAFKKLLAPVEEKISADKLKKYKISELFEINKGEDKYRKKYIRIHNGSFPVYSSQTKHNGVIGLIDTFDYDVGQCVTWTTDGVYAGTVFLREGKFSMTTHCGILIPKQISGLYLPYIYHVLKSKLRKLAIGQEKQNKRVTVDVIQGMEIEVPISRDDKLDFEKQAEIASQYENIQKKLDEAMRTKDELIILLKKGLLR